MVGQARARLLVVLTIGTLFAMAFVPVALAGKKPGGGGVTTPGNFRVVGTTAYSVTFAWTASQSSAGIASYTICCANVSSLTVPGNQTTGVFSAGVFPGATHSYRIFARDNAGRASDYSPSITVTTPRDTSSPSKPTVTVTDVGPRHVSLSWSATDDDPNPMFSVFVNGASSAFQNMTGGSGTVTSLDYATEYSFTVRARDHNGNLSPLSDPVTATTLPKNTGDVTPPTAPPGLFATFWASDGETWLRWGDSTDAVTPTSRISYCIFINDVLDGCQVGGNWTILYGPPFSINTYGVEAVDESGNVSGRSEIEVDNR